MESYAIKHKSGKFLKNEYITASNRISYISMVKTDFPIFYTKEEAIDYINTGDELFYTYDNDLRKEDLKIVIFKESVD